MNNSDDNILREDAVIISNEQNQVDDSLNQNDHLVLEQINHETDNDDNFDLQSFNEMFHEINDQKEYACSILTYFFYGKLTQRALESQLSFLKIIKSNIDLPSDFNGLVKVLTRSSDEKIDYEKFWYCQKCQTYMEPETRFQRNCKKCCER